MRAMSAVRARSRTISQASVGPALAAWALVACALVACGGRDRPEHRGAPEESSPEPTPAPVQARVDARAAREVSFTTSDGVTVHGTLRPGSHDDAPAVILVHQLASTRAEWAPLIDRLALERSVTTLAIDLRGHGESTVGPSGPLDWHSFDGDAWTASRLDVEAAVDWLVSDASGLHPSAFAAVGSSIGATAVVASAADDPRLAVLVTLSPGRAYHGFDAIGPASHLENRAILAVVAREESDNVNTAQLLARIGATEPVLVDGEAHGVLLFAADPSALDRAEAFLREQLSSPRDGTLPPGSIPPPPVTSAGTPALPAPT